MTQAELRLCSLLLRENFGEIVEKVGNSLLRTGPRPLRLLVGDTGLLPDQVKKALCVLLQHGLARYAPQPRGPVEYEARSRRVLRLLRYPRYIYTAKTLYGDPGELLVEELLLHGHLPMSAAVARVAERLTETMEDGKSMDVSEVSATFVRLADTHFIQRCPAPPALPPEVPPDARVPPPAPASEDKDRFLVPRLGLGGKGKRRHSCDEEEEGEHRAKRQKQEGGSSEPPPDDGIYWQVNLERFHQHFRDQALVSAVASRMDQTSSEVVRTMLRMSEVTTASGASHTQPLSSNEIFRSLPAGYNISKAVLDQYLALLADDPLEFVGKAGDSGGGTYTVNLHKALVSLATATLESIVEERFGSRCARIFRLLLRKKHLEQKQVEDFAMIPAKEAKDMLYRMLSENLVALQEIPKTPDHAPSRTFYLYTVNVMAAARMLLHRCYQSVANLMERRHHEMRENKRLLEKSQRVEAILASMQATGAEAAQLHEVEEMITGPERQQLENLKRNVNKIDASENQVDETIFVLEAFIESTMKRP
uniref:DNA-directed RNA polymerase III subunit RPC3 n=1 Tax=Taeniopygia guttata TaxID=59729 RepID=H1A2X7_TAEGU|nr:DNA-directed RNA polymerase III subunit RPC3 [Taeniopygia guttata]XP_041577046.1 DNA-directed RNA polymerase III subunit RPC3 [Taeniopygia guttata]XP_041577047.1 DNA-directed RNA polymerase III subunit RPC3 [Taeniopygia guttata]XP_041577048.1 DNA-directed RNA polymerase III subunit RPC3 [Taeniopygia guttata]XP_041577049.1 DNA-directed RNA polymerase III subunit RPC3 [Taeniopygia guttata]XP_041577050.1 DNA-directed RNA polymerase III subunit RPC3 [Taeniopygia guttata]XP_041577051.1 DNA-dire